MVTGKNETGDTTNSFQMEYAKRLMRILYETGY